MLSRGALSRLKSCRGLALSYSRLHKCRYVAVVDVSNVRLQLVRVCEALAREVTAMQAWWERRRVWT